MRQQLPPGDSPGAKTLRSAATRGGSWVLFAWLFATSLSAADRPADAEHLLFLADHGLAVIRLGIEIDGQSHRELCQSSLQAICTDADRDHDGFLTAEEYDARVASHPVLQERQARVMRRPNAPPERPEFGAAGKLSVPAVTAYLLRNVWSPLTLEFAASQMRRISTTGEFLDRPFADTQLFERLDTDGNRKLTSRELERAAGVLGKLDFDEDETISLDELRMQPTSNVMPAANPNRPARRSDNHLSQLTADRIDAQFVRRILSLYDGEVTDSVKDHRLDRNEVGLPEKLFSKADADRDGYWDFDELWRFLERPVPTVDIAMRLASDATPTAAEFLSADSGTAKLLEQHPGMISFEIHGTRIQLFLPASTRQEQHAQDIVKSQLQSLDKDKNEYLELSEFQPAGAEEQSQPIFQAMDTNGDGKLYLEELLAYYRLIQAARENQLTLNADNLERTLFGPLDADGDGRLSQRELAGLKARLPEWDSDGDGKLMEEEIPQQYRLTLSRGANTLFGVGANIVGAATMSFETGTATGTPSSTTPLWFRKMDRNRDGEVSAREFLGTVEQFERTDTNSDGAIDAGEAAAVK